MNNYIINITPYFKLHHHLNWTSIKYSYQVLKKIQTRATVSFSPWLFCVLH